MHLTYNASQIFVPKTTLPFTLSDVDTIDAPESELLITMNSLEIAQLTGKRHDHLMTDIRRLLEDLGYHAPDFSGTYKNDRGNTYECFYLPRDLTETLITGYSAPLRLAVVRRLQKLETSTHAQLLISYSERLFELNQKIRDDAPKVGFYDNMADATQLFSVGRVAKSLDTGPNLLFRYMRDWRILMSKRQKFNEPYQQHMTAGRFEVKWGNYKDETTGEIECKAITHFTCKGVLWIHQFIAKHGRDGL